MHPQFRTIVCLEQLWKFVTNGQEYLISEFHNILAAHMENRSFEIIPDESRVQTSRQKKRPFWKKSNETTKTEHNMIKGP